MCYTCVLGGEMEFRTVCLQENTWKSRRCFSRESPFPTQTFSNSIQIEEKDAPLLFNPTIQSALSTILWVLPSAQIIGGVPVPETTFQAFSGTPHSPLKAHCVGFKMLRFFKKNEAMILSSPHILEVLQQVLSFSVHHLKFCKFYKYIKQWSGCLRSMF